MNEKHNHITSTTDRTLMDRTLLERALRSVTDHFSPQSGYLHFGGSVPLVENALYALALLKTRNVEQVQEGRKLLRKLLSLQMNDTLFPKSLYDYPIASDGHVTVELTLIFEQIQRLGEVVLGEVVSAQLTMVLQSIAVDPETLSLGHALLVKGVDGVEGCIELMDQLPPRTVGFFMNSLLMRSNLPTHLLNRLVTRALSLWHPETSSYIGFAAPTSLTQPRTCFDWLMAAICKRELPLSNSAHELEAVLIRNVPDSNIEGSKTKWSLVTSGKIPSYSQRFHFAPVRFFADQISGVVSLPTGSIKHVVRQGDEVEIICQLDPERVEWGKEGGHLLSWYSNYARTGEREVHHWLVNGNRANIFYPEERLECAFGSSVVQLSFSVESSHAKGEILPSIRPSDKSEKKIEHFHPLDWEISLRLLRPPIPETVAIRLKIT